MEMEQMPQPGPGMCGSDREVFQRVWRRVMETGGGESPVEVAPAEPEPPAQTLPAPALPASALPAPALPAAEEEACCLGPASAVYGEVLQRFIQGELQAAAAYAALARLGGRRSAVRLSALAAQERRHAKRLSAAYFLISGVYYHPAGQAAPRLERTFLGSLRARFLAEQREEAAYRAAADCRDPCLRELFLELAGEERGHSQTLRGILEEL